MKRIDHTDLWTAKACQMRLALQEIYWTPHRLLARRRFDFWCGWVRCMAKKAPGQLLEAMVKVAEMKELHLAGVPAHWIAR